MDGALKSPVSKLQLPFADNARSHSDNDARQKPEPCASPFRSPKDSRLQIDESSSDSACAKEKAPFEWTPNN